MSVQTLISQENIFFFPFCLGWFFSLPHKCADKLHIPCLLHALMLLTDMTDGIRHGQQGVFVLECHPVGCRPVGNDTAVTLWQECSLKRRFLCRCYMHIKVNITVTFKTFSVSANWGLAYSNSDYTFTQSKMPAMFPFIDFPL